MTQPMYSGIAFQIIENLTFTILDCSLMVLTYCEPSLLTLSLCAYSLYFIGYYTLLQTQKESSIDSVSVYDEEQLRVFAREQQSREQLEVTQLKRDATACGLTFVSSLLSFGLQAFGFGMVDPLVQCVFLCFMGVPKLYNIFYLHTFQEDTISNFSDLMLARDLLKSSTPTSSYST